MIGETYCQACSINFEHVAVHVDVDFMGPFVTSVKKASKDVWLQLPPPVRHAAPYVGAGVGTGVLVFSIQQRRLDHAVSNCSCNISTSESAVVCVGADSLCCWLQTAKNKALEQRLEVLTTERDDAKILAKELKVWTLRSEVLALTPAIIHCSKPNINAMLCCIFSLRPQNRKVLQRSRWWQQCHRRHELQQKLPQQLQGLLPSASLIPGTNHAEACTVMIEGPPGEGDISQRHQALKMTCQVNGKTFLSNLPDDRIVHAY